MGPAKLHHDVLDDIISWLEGVVPKPAGAQTHRGSGSSGDIGGMREEWGRVVYFARESQYDRDSIGTSKHLIQS